MWIDIITIAQFRATKRRSEDLGRELSFDTGRGKVGGFIYADRFHIEDTATWESGERQGQFYLRLDQREWSSDTIEPLETRLFAYCVAEDAGLAATIFGHALDAACASIQVAIGVTTGDKAAAHFSGRPREEFDEIMVGYLLAEAMS